MWILEVSLSPFVFFFFSESLRFGSVWFGSWLIIVDANVATRASFGPPALPMEDRPGWVLAGPIPFGRILVFPAV